MATDLQLPTEINGICRQFGVQRLELFGSASRGEFKLGESDFDFFVQFQSHDWKGAFKRYMGLKLALEDLLHAPVDLVDTDGKVSPLFLKVAARDRKLIYAA